MKQTKTTLSSKPITSEHWTWKKFSKSL